MLHFVTQKNKRSVEVWSIGRGLGCDYSSLLYYFCVENKVTSRGKTTHQSGSGTRSSRVCTHGADVFAVPAHHSSGNGPPDSPGDLWGKSDSFNTYTIPTDASLIFLMMFRYPSTHPTSRSSSFSPATIRFLPAGVFSFPPRVFSP